ncbi:PIN domain-containing protein [Acidisphaera rubrifaciens]|uniref:Ribonuclease VapC n=1 Tax=Acidisphaera rubrifaciens HS-AP3 TaxID=1231350 RepID=A0A0D6P8H2_9PROT|nr:PIN domain-containing protein [Acidisphaera rubrifaciens]GAN78080.1 pilus retraction motor hexameric ATPase PilT [Acidisphaera rubrifaciens HS-AP3]
MYLVDTNVLSAGAPARAAHGPGLVAWMEGNSDRLYLSVITVAEVEDGIAKARRERATRKADRLAAWLQTLLHLYSARVLPLDLPAARLLGSLSDRARAAGRAPCLADLAIAATAAGRGYTVLTRNLRHFDGLGVLTHDPYASLPP